MKAPKSICRVAVLAAVVGSCLAAPNTLEAISIAPGSAPTSLATPTKPAKIAAAPTTPRSVANEDIRDIRGPYHIPPGWLWLAWAAGGLTLAGLGYAAWRWRHRLTVRAKLPYEIALEQLEAARKLMQPEHAREFSIAVSEVVRDYIENGFHVRAAHRTTEEFIRDLATRPDSPLISHQPVLADFLSHCDLAKFARWILSVPQMEAMLQSASNFIVVTGKPADNISSTTPVDKPSSTSSPGRPTVTPASSVAKTLNPQTL